jgi:hypothetical protein
VKQVAYFELINAGHYVGKDQGKAVVSVLKGLVGKTGKMLQTE